MKKGIVLLILSVLFNLGAKVSAQPGYAGEWKKTRLYGHTYASNGFTQEQYEFIRDHHEIFCFEKTHLNGVYGNPSHEKSSKIEAAYLKSLNPRCKPITIYSIRRAYPVWNESTAEALAEHPGWATTDDNVKYNWDLDNQERNDWYVETMNALVDSSDLEGIFIDGLEGVYSTYGDQAKSIMERMHGLSLMNGFNPKGDSQFKTGPDFLEHCAGVFVDSWFRRDLDTKEAAAMMIDTCIEVPDEKVLILFSGNNNDGIWGTDHTFSHAAYLIVAGENTYYRWSGDGLWGADVLMEYHEDFDKEMGEPLSKAVKTGYKYERVFKYCTVNLDLENKTSSIVWNQNNTLINGEGFTITSNTDTVRVGYSAQLSAVFSPVNTSYQGITWSSGNSAIASVNSNGVVIARKPGTVTISGISTVGNFTEDIKITVIANSVEGMSITPTEVSLLKSRTEQLTAIITPAGANTNVNWITMDSTLATVSASGLITAHNIGTVKIVGISEDGGFSDTCTVTIDALPISIIYVNPPKATLAVGDSMQLLITILPEAASDQTIIWSTSDSSIAVVSQTGMAHMLSAGEATITASSNDGNKTDDCVFTIYLGTSNIDHFSIGHIKSGLNIYPNPANEKLYLEWEEANNEKSIIEIYSLSGKLMSAKNVNQGNIDLSELTRGMYLLRVVTHDFVATKRFIKQQ